MNQENEVAKLSKTQYYKEWYIKNQDKIKQARKVWYESNRNNDEYKQKRKEYNKLYYLKKKIQNKTE